MPQPHLLASIVTLIIIVVIINFDLIIDLIIQFILSRVVLVAVSPDEVRYSHLLRLIK